MPKLSNEDLIKKVSDFVGEDTSDAALSLLEDVSDTLKDANDVSKYEAEIAELRKKVDEIDTSWREKYKARFTDVTPTMSADVKTEVDTGANNEEGDIEPPSFEELGDMLAQVEI